METGHTGKSTKSAQVTEVNKTCFELCVFERIAEELSTGDLFIPYSETFDDYREQMITWEEYEAQLPPYCEEVGLSPVILNLQERRRNPWKRAAEKPIANFRRMNWSA